MITCYSTSLKTYASKLLLFGEYTIINGSRALAVPHAAYRGYWKEGTTADERLLRFADYLEGQAQLRSVLDLPAFRTDLEAGLFFDSNIPIGYGLGSSGALCAAVYDRYAREPVGRTDLDQFASLRRQLALMESHFHGSSSGTDPLICYLQTPVLLQAEGKIDLVDLPDFADLPFAFFLLDTGIARSTGPLVEHYLEQCRTETYAHAIRCELVPLVDSVIDDFLAGAWDRVHRQLSAISRLQWEHFQRMIPDTLKSVWRAGLAGGGYTLKLCGAGGGGFLLGIGDTPAAIDQLNDTFPCSRLWAG